MEVPAWLPRAAAAHPDRPAVETPEGALTYRQLDGRASRAAAALAARGAGEGSRIALLAEPDLDFAVALHACLLLRAVAMPIDPRLGEAERAAQTAAVKIWAPSPFLRSRERKGTEPFLSLAATHALDAVAAVVHTSGTSGEPRPVELTYGNWLWSAAGSAVALGLDPAERWLCPLPLSHVGGLSILIRSAISGTTAVLHPRFDAEAVAAALRDERTTLVSVVPTMVRRLLDAGLERPPALRCMLVGGGPLDPGLAERARAAGLPIAQTYGLTEACSQVTTSAPGEPETAGPPLFCTRVRTDEDDEILVAGPTVAPLAAGEDGWLRTGDLGRLDERGRLTVTGRRADTIVTGGENVAPGEVEAALLDHPAVAEAAVHAGPDAEWGERVVATVVLRDGAEATADDLRAHAGARLAAFKVPKEIRFAPALPRTATGKVRRGDL